MKPTEANALISNVCCRYVHHNQHLYGHSFGQENVFNCNVLKSTSHAKLSTHLPV